MSQREQKYNEMIQVLRIALVERRLSDISYHEMFDRIIRQEMTKSFDQQNYIIMNGMGFLRQNLSTTTGELRNVLLLRVINDPDVSNRQNHRMGLIEQLEQEISPRLMNNDDGIDNDGDGNNHFRYHYPTSGQQQQLRSHSRERAQVIVIHSDSETESDSETVSACCPRSVRDRIQRLLEPKLRNRIRREIEPQLRGKIRREMEPQLRDQIRRELRPQLRDQLRREMMPQLMDQIHREMEPQLRVQIRRELEPMRENIENEIREADEHNAWIDFLLHNIDEFEIDTTLDAAIAICEVCISPCMNRRSITLNCGHIFCGNCIRVWALENRVCPKCRTQIRFSRSVFRAYPTMESNQSI